MHDDKMEKLEVIKSLLQEIQQNMKGLMVAGKADDEMSEDDMSSEIPMEESSLENADALGDDMLEVARNGAELGEDPAKVSSDLRDEDAPNKVDETNAAMEGTNLEDDKEGLKSFLRGKSNMPKSSEGVTVSLLGMKKPGYSKDDKMPSFMQKGKKSKGKY